MYGELMGVAREKQADDRRRAEAFRTLHARRRRDRQQGKDQRGQRLLRRLLPA